MVQRKRRQLFVDPHFQGALLKRCIMQWGFCIVIAALTLLCGNVISNPGEPNYTYFVDLWFTYWKALIVCLILLFVALVDFVRLSNKVCGPILRLRTEMRHLAAGKPVKRIKFREGDFWHEFSSEFNSLVDRVQTIEIECAESDSKTPFIESEIADSTV